LNSHGGAEPPCSGRLAVPVFISNYLFIGHYRIFTPFSLFFPAQWEAIPRRALACHILRGPTYPWDFLNLVSQLDVCGHETRGLLLTVNNKAIQEGYICFYDLRFLCEELYGSLQGLLGLTRSLMPWQ